MSDRSSRFDGLFGSPEDDPLLQDDPLAPGSGDAGAEDEAPDDDPSGPSSASSDAPDDRPAQSSSGDDQESLDALLGSSSGSSDPDSSGSLSSSERMLRITQENAAGGRLAPLKVALNRGWHLQRIELDSASSEDAAPPLVFHLRRSSTSA